MNLFFLRDLQQRRKPPTRLNEHLGFIRSNGLSALPENQQEPGCVPIGSEESTAPASIQKLKVILRIEIGASLNSRNTRYILTDAEQFQPTAAPQTPSQAKSCTSSGHVAKHYLHGSACYLAYTELRRHSA